MGSGPFFQNSGARTTLSAIAASASAPPAMPLYTGISALCTSSVNATMPRSELVMHGRPAATFSVSLTTITSDLMRSLVLQEETHQVGGTDLLLGLDEHL